jgi:hypothetical protein
MVEFTRSTLSTRHRLSKLGIRFASSNTLPCINLLSSSKITLFDTVEKSTLRVSTGRTLLAFGCFVMDDFAATKSNGCRSCGFRLNRL